MTKYIQYIDGPSRYCDEKETSILDSLKLTDLDSIAPKSLTSIKLQRPLVCRSVLYICILGITHVDIMDDS